MRRPAIRVRRRAAAGVLLCGLLGVPLRPAADAPAQHVEVTAPTPGDREQKSVAQLLEAQRAFERHHARAPQAGLAFRLYARLDPADLARLHLDWVAGDERRRVRLDDHQRFVLDPAWTAPGAARDAVLQTNLPDGTIAWKVDVRTPGYGDDVRRLGDLRLECEADMFHGNLQRGIHSPSAAIMAAEDDLCELDDAEIYFAERPIFGVLLESGDRARRLPYRYVHVSDGTMALAGLFDWPYALRDRSFYLPLEDRSWPDDARVVFDYMDAPQGASPPAAPTGAAGAAAVEAPPPPASSSAAAAGPAGDASQGGDASQAGAATPGSGR
jgi:hypothetical protein